MVTARDRVWAAVIRLTNEQAGFSVEDVSAICKELFGDDAPDSETIQETVGVMDTLGVVEPFDVEADSSYYVPTHNAGGL